MLSNCTCFEGERKFFSKNGILAFVLFYAATLLLAAILAPIMFFFVKYCADRFSIELFQHFIEKGFEKFFDRARLISLVVLLFPFLRIVKLTLSRGISFSRIGLCKFCTISLIGFFFVHVVYGWLVSSNNFSFSEITIYEFFTKLPKFVFSAAAIAFLEEIIFRGIILRLFLRSFNIVIAIILASIFFAYCHFGPANFKIAAADVTIFSGFQCIFPTLVGICSKFNLLNFCNLFMLGILLSSLLLRFGSLLCPIAFHFGIVLAIMNIRSFVRIFSIIDGERANVSILDTWLTLFLQIIFIVCIVLWRRENDPAQDKDIKN